MLKKEEIDFVRKDLITTAVLAAINESLRYREDIFSMQTRVINAIEALPTTTLEINRVEFEPPATYNQ